MKTPTNTKLVSQIQQDVEDWVTQDLNPVHVAQAAQWLMNEFIDLNSQLSQYRTEAVKLLLSEGWSLAEVGELLGVHRTRIYQIAK
jgi:hypothetical protein